MCPLVLVHFAAVFFTFSLFSIRKRGCAEITQNSAHIELMQFGFKNV
jgi:hypothetical protein